VTGAGTRRCSPAAFAGGLRGADLPPIRARLLRRLRADGGGDSAFE